MSAAAPFGMLGLMIIAPLRSSKIDDNDLHFFNLEDGSTFLLTREVVSDLLKDYPEIRPEFDTSANNSKAEILIKYLQIADSLRTRGNTAGP